jgi:hypothetical protein
MDQAVALRGWQSHQACQSPSASNPAAARNVTASWKCRSTNIMPTGKPLRSATGTLIAG